MQQGENLPRFSRFAKYAWFLLAYNVAVVVWGAYVRATGSGAGCGQHWPLCNGEIIPLAPGSAMLIEFSHRVTSGLTLLFVAILAIWAFRSFPKGSIVRTGAILAVVFTISEALVGAGLVLFQLVAQNASMERAFSVAVHLTNTFLLLAALTLTALWASGGKPIRLSDRGPSLWFIGLGLLGVLVLGVSGAVTALGDTLFPSSSLTEGLQQDFSPTAQFLTRLRVFHPFLAVGVGVYVILLARALSSLSTRLKVRPLAMALTLLVLTQWIAGVLNIYLLAPVWMQLLHLFLADMVWIALVLFAATILAEPVGQVSERNRLRRLLLAIIRPDAAQIADHLNDHFQA
ncbi:MAG TPA: COX15/CtaA family protein [Anaerolineae bacterium]